MIRALLSATPLVWACLLPSAVESLPHEPTGILRHVKGYAFSGEPDPCLGGEDCDPPATDGESLVPAPDPISSRLL